MSDKWEIVALPQGDEIMKNGKVASVDEAARILNYHHRLREALGDVVGEWVYGDDIFGPIQKARALLAELDNLEGDDD